LISIFVGSSVTIGESSTFIGTILAQTSITIGTFAVITGRILADTAITFTSGSTVSLPG
jgi:type VI secretion system secreted protein VgrG